MAVEVHPIVNRESWLADRKQFINASSVGACPAFNCHPYITPLHVFAEKRGVIFPDDPDNKVLRRGRWLEASFPKIVKELRPELTLTAPNALYCDTEIGLASTPDFFYDGLRGLGLVECKTVAMSVWKRDWDLGKDVPLWVILQLLSGMMLCGAVEGAVAVMLVDPHNMDVAILDVPRHAEAEQKIIAEVKRFWDDIRNGREPDPDFARDADVIRAMLPREQPGKTSDFAGNNRLIAMLEQRAALKETMTEADAACNAIESEIKHLMGDAELATGLNGWRITFKSSDRAGYTVPAKTLRMLRITDRREKQA